MMAILGLLMPVFSGLLEKFIPDPAARARAQQELLTAMMQIDTSQLEVNKAEAASGSMFVGGWRPFIGWVCGLALFYQYLFVPLVMWFGFVIGNPIPKPPTLDDQLWQLMLGMLGMGGLRTFEKIKGIATK